MEENDKRGHHATAPPPKLLVFDLDGTLIDSKADLIHSVNAVRAYLSMPALAGETIASYVGNGAPVLIRKAMGEEATQEQVDTALEYFVKYYHEHALDHTKLYPGCQSVLESAQERGLRCAILTNKPVRISHHILDGLGVLHYFFRVYGGNSFPTKKPDPQGLNALVEEARVQSQETLMIGDSSVDILTARNAGTRSVGLTYGLQPASLQEVPPDLLLDRMEDLLVHL